MFAASGMGVIQCSQLFFIVDLAALDHADPLLETRDIGVFTGNLDLDALSRLQTDHHFLKFGKQVTLLTDDKLCRAESDLPASSGQIKNGAVIQRAGIVYLYDISVLCL
jgi:hypothetical protein